MASACRSRPRRGPRHRAHPGRPAQCARLCLPIETFYPSRRRASRLRDVRLQNLQNPCADRSAFLATLPTNKQDARADRGPHAPGRTPHEPGGHSEDRFPHPALGRLPASSRCARRDGPVPAHPPVSPSREKTLAAPRPALPAAPQTADVFTDEEAVQLPTRGDTFGICAAIAASTLVLATASPASAHTPRSYATTRTVPTVSSPVSASPARTTTAHDASPAEAWTSAAAEKFWTPSGWPRPPRTAPAAGPRRLETRIHRERGGCG